MHFVSRDERLRLRRGRDDLFFFRGGGGATIEDEKFDK